jgi:hypothetical protein
MKRLRILLWCPLVGMGGGHRLLGHLLKALTNQSLVEHVKIVHPHWSADMKASIVDPSVSSIEFSESEEGGFISWLEAGERVFNIWGTGFAKRVLSKPFVGINEKHYNRRLSELCRDVDIVYAFWPHLQKPPNVDKPLVCTFQDTLFLDFPELLGGNRAKAEWIRTNNWVQRSNGLIVSSQSTKASLMKHFGEKVSSAIVIHHAISTLDTESTKPRESELLIRRVSGQYIRAEESSHTSHRMEPLFTP